MQDTTNINFLHFDYWCSGFNSFLLQNYLLALKLKYLYGGSGTAGTWALGSRICYTYGKSNKKVYRQKVKEVAELLQQYQLQLDKKGLLVPVSTPVIHLEFL